MKNDLPFIWHLIVAFVKLCRSGGYRKLAAENTVLRHQLLVMARSQKRAPKLTASDRFILGLCSLWMSKKRLVKNAIIIKPSTLIRFHKALVDKKYSALFSSNNKKKPGPKGPSQDLINVIIEMKNRNPRFGAPKISEQINLAFGLDIDKDVVRRVLENHYKPISGNDGPSWLTFLGHTKDSLWSVDFFRCESANIKSHWVMVVMDQFTRRIIDFAVHPGDLNGVAVCRLFNKIISKQSLPKYLSSDNDPLFKCHRWKANLRVLEIDEIKSIPCTPTSHPFVERLIGTIRRELLDHILFWNSSDLERKLGDFKEFYNEQRTHSGIDGKTPIENQPKTLNLKNFLWQDHCRGLFSLPLVA